MKHIMCVRFPRWSVDLAKRKLRRSRRDSSCSHPLVLVQTTSSRQTVVAACDVAMSAGVSAGMTLAEARAMVVSLVWRDFTPELDDRSLRALAIWMIRFSPVVSVEPPDAVFLDLTGSDRLFGGYDRLTALVSAAVGQWGFSFRIAVAPAPGAAWALASFGENNGAIIAPSELSVALEPLPIEALRMGGEVTAMLHSLGIQSVRQLRKLPRKTLPARFGSTVLMRIDQALGLVAEPLVAIVQPRQVRAMIEFETGIDSLEMLLEVTRRLNLDVTNQLRQQGRGARRLLLELMPGDDAARAAPPRSRDACFALDRRSSTEATQASQLQKEIHLSKATCNPSVIFNLLRCAIESVKSQTVLAKFSLTVLESQRLTLEQLDFLDQETRNAEADFGHLMERLRVRLGAGTVLFPSLAASHLPERAFALTEMSEVPKACKSSVVPSRFKPRPLVLMPEPAEIRCMVSPSASGEGIPLAFSHRGESFKIVHAGGPEKISGIWWEGRNKTREYFDAEVQDGRRFWLFRVTENKRWFLQGIFDG